MIAAQRIYTMCCNLDYADKQMEMVWEIFKNVICEDVDLLISRHLDHVLICSIYAVSKKTGNHYQRAQKTFADVFER